MAPAKRVLTSDATFDYIDEPSWRRVTSHDGDDEDAQAGSPCLHLGAARNLVD